MIELCPCESFDLWYIDDQDEPPWPVCKCGHPDNEHIDRFRTCVGEIEWKAS